MKIKSVYIEITNLCNLNCRDCYNSSGLNHRTVEIDADVLMRFIHDLCAVDKARDITISGGEPLLHTHINEILNAMSDFSIENPDVAFNFITNGTVNNEQFYGLLEKNPSFTVQISLDGPNEYANASMRGAGNFSRVINNISGRTFINKPVFKMIINKTNYTYVEEYAYFVMEKFGGLPGYAFAEPFGNAVTNWGEMVLPVKECTDIIIKIRDIYEKYDIKGISLPMPASHCELADSKPELTLCIKSNGSVQPCQNFYDDKFSIGNIYSFDRDSVFENIYRLSACLSERLSDRLSCDYGCTKCPLHVKCGRGCPAISEAVYGDMLASDGECELRKLSTMRLIKTKLDRNICSSQKKPLD